MGHPDIEFGAEEKLWRRIEFREVTGGKVKAGKIRLQISTVREKGGELTQVTQGKWNGVAEISAKDATLLDGPLQFVVAHEPTGGPLPNDEAHTLIACVLEPGCPLEQSRYDNLRDNLAEKFTVIVPPTKV